MNEFGLNIANRWGATIAATHLYNAVQQEVPSFPSWQDMEVLVFVHGQKTIFWDGIPSSPTRYSKSYDLSTGVASMIASRNIRTGSSGHINIITPPNVEQRGLATVSEVSWLFHER